MRKPRTTKGSKLPDIMNASIDALPGTQEHKLALKRQRIEGEITNVRRKYFFILYYIIYISLP